MPDREESERTDESFDVKFASDEELAQKIRDLADDLFFLTEVAKSKGLAVLGCSVEGKSTYVLGHQNPVSVQTEVKVVRTIVL